MLMAVRLLSALVGCIIGITILVLDNLYVYTAMIMFLSAVGVWEIIHAIKCDGHKAMCWVSVVFAAIFPASIIIGQQYPFVRVFTLPLAMGYVLIMALLMLRDHKNVKFEQVLSCGAAGGLLPTALSCIILLRFSECGKPLGIFMILFVLFSAWFGDSGAFFVGTFLGKHKLCPTISPKKTVEGLVGGIVTVGVVMAITLVVYNVVGLTEHQLNYAVLIPLSMFASLVGVVGDLSASVIKREHNVKDFGNIMPGHGGVIDRFDSVIFVAPFLYVALTYLGNYIYL